ncbi:MAG: PEP-CTERM sorting domain-containing protein [Nitrospirota bacterium]
MGIIRTCGICDKGLTEFICDFTEGQGMFYGKHLIAKFFWVFMFLNILCSESYAVPIFSYTENVNTFALTITGGDVAGPPPLSASYRFDLTGNWNGTFSITEYPVGGGSIFTTDAVYLASSWIRHNESSNAFMPPPSSHGILMSIDAGGVFKNGTFIGSVPHPGVGGTPHGVDIYVGSSSFGVSGANFTNYTISVQGVHHAVPVPEPATAVPVPEPATMLLLGTGIIGLFGEGWYRRRDAKLRIR